VTADEIVCREFVELSTEYLEAALPPETLELVEEHLVMCDWCRDYTEQIVATAQAVAGMPPPAPPEVTLRALLGAFRRHAGGADPPAGGDDDGGGPR
jgi:predicted anti-sigma-YlaC factor YlaD